MINKELNERLLEVEYMIETICEKMQILWDHTIKERKPFTREDIWSVDFDPK